MIVAIVFLMIAILVSVCVGKDACNTRETGYVNDNFETVQQG